MKTSIRKIRLTLAVLSFTAGCYAQSGATWTFEPRTDPFEEDCLLDLRFLNEKVAGEKGWMTARDGKFYIPGSDMPFRAWSAGLSPHGASYSKEELAYSARAFSKRGINQVREMGRANVSIIRNWKDGDMETLDPEGLGALHRLVAAMKKEGIYTTYSPWWGITVKEQPKYPGFAKNQAFYWCEDLQHLMKGWLRQLLTTVNPETGIPLAEDPALNIIELQNEENLFFGLAPGACDEARWSLFEKKFSDFVVSRHEGTLAEIVESWKMTAEEREEYVDGNGDDMRFKVGNFNSTMFRCINQPTPGLKAYATELLEFVTHLERSFNDEIARFIKDECGYGGLFTGGDWWANPRPRFNDLARWGTVPPRADCVAYHQYSSFYHVNPTKPQWAKYRWGEGDYYCDGSVLAEPSYLPTRYKRMRSVPMIITETGLPVPNRYALEGQLAYAVYGSLQDHDQITFLHVMFGDYDGSKLYNKFCHNWPHLLGQFPGAALLYRLGYVDEGPVVVSYRKPVADYLVSPPIIEDVLSGDPLHRKAGQKDSQDDPAGPPPEGDAVDSLAFQVGAVEYETGSPPEQKVDRETLADCIDRTAKKVRSATGQLELDWGRQLLTINTPAAQGATGLLGSVGRIELDDIVIECENDLAAILVICLDGKPLKTSGHILVQAVTKSSLTGARHVPVEAGTEVILPDRKGKPQRQMLPDGAKKIEAIGKLPYQIENIRATITFKSRTVARATAADLYGYAIADRSVPVESAGAGSRIKLPSDAYYTIIHQQKWRIQDR